MSRTHPSPTVALRRVVAAAACTVLVITLAACSAPAEPEPRRLTTSESELLSAARFRNYDAGTRRIDVSIAGQGSRTELTGYYDFVAHAGLVEVVSDGGSATPDDAGFTNYVWWTPSVVGEVVVEGSAPDWEGGIPTLDPTWEWEFYELDASASTLITTLALVTAMGADRPDNPQLIAQSDALWLGSTSDGVWFQLPSSDELAPATGNPQESTTVPRFLVSDDGVIQRAVVTLADASTATIEFGTSSRDVVPLPEVPASGG